MPINEQLADRVRELIAEEEDNVEEKKMFGGMCFMVNDKMCVCISGDRIMVRIPPEHHEDALHRPGVEPMVHSGRSMKGFVYVEEDAIRTRKNLLYWVRLALDYNKIAKPSKKKR